MKRIDARTVEFTDHEMMAKDLFDDYLDKGFSIPFASKLAINRTQRKLKVQFTHTFIGYLSDDTCKRWGLQVVIKPEWRDKPVQEVKS